MVELPPEETTVSKIYDHYVSTAQDWRRPHLGASQIGKPCERALWYQFRWCVAPGTQKDGRMLRLFETGNIEEDRIVQNLRDIGISVIDKLPNGKQIHMQDAKCPYFSGSMDGVGHGFIEAPKALHVLEFKTSSTKQFKRVLNLGVKEAKPEHYAQMQMYMHWSHQTDKPIKRAYYFMVCKETDEIYGERVYYLADHAETLTRKAYKIIQANEPPARVSGAGPKHSACLFCDYKDLCLNKNACAEVNCRTCAHWSPGSTSAGECNKVCMDVDPHEGCNRHIFIPALNPLEFVSADAQTGTITYLMPDGKQITNGPGHMSSTKLREMINNE